MRGFAVALALAACLSAVAFGADDPARAQTPAPVTATPAGNAAVAAAVDPVANAIVRTGRVPGLAIAVERHGEIVFERAYGLAVVETKAPVTLDTRFEIGSVTKQFTAACVMQLVEAKKMSLDDHLGAYLSDYFVGRGVTIRQLLQQTSGIPEYFEGFDMPGAAADSATFSTLLARISAKPLEFPPGSRWKYSNSNYAILARIVQIVAREPYETYVREHIFEPAGMTASGFIGDDAAGYAHGYRAVAGRGAVAASPLRAGWLTGPGSIVSTVGDLVKWNDALDAGKIVSIATVAAMRTPATLADGTVATYGFGLIVDPLDGHARAWHNGETFGFYALDSTFPSDGESIVVLTNSTLPVAESLTRDAFAALHPDVASASSAATPAPGEDPAITARVRRAFAGFQAGEIDASAFSERMSEALTQDKLAALADQIRPLGSPAALIFRGSSRAGGFTTYAYRATFEFESLAISMSIDGDDKIASYAIRPI